ncbi:hypothetical protein B0H34DRAFT_681448 [Crassisporium funariophilum]|nr:hypothetical protein B0H34DRAFT_681448 [Crassisporium funariophilum]
MLFTIKATYRGHTRKHTFSDTNTFPSYEQICNQLHRVFSITQDYYLSKLLFSPDAAQPSRILLGKEVLTSYDYQKCIRQFKGRTWPHALLRFSVVDGRPYYPGLINGGAHSQAPQAVHSTFTNSRAISMSHIPPPPIIFSSSPSASSQVSMDVDTSTTGPFNQGSQRPGSQRSTPQHQTSASAPRACCSVSQGKAEVEVMLQNFQEGLNRVMTSNFSTPLGSNPFLPGTSFGERNTLSSVTSAPPPFLCSVCTQNISRAESLGSWYSCDNCHLVVCEACHNKERPGFCLSVMGSHNMKLASLAPNQRLPIPRLPTWMPRSESSDSGIQNAPFVPPVTLTPATPALVVHTGVVCDACNKNIEGVRHKCLDCPDYDLCTACITSESATAHDPFHEFFDITEPGRVIVHTVFSGTGERDAPSTPATRAPTSEAPVSAQQATVHYANCDLCDSRILGDRYKCLNCPDFDTCTSCFRITDEQHPHHAFVKITKREDYIRRRPVARSMHYATCNGCTKKIFGLRFKCMHPDCPDYDLCENCEALPIAVHPSNHPLLKMRAPDTVIPTVYRVGQHTLIHESNASPVADSMIPTASACSRAPSTASTANASVRQRSPSPVPPAPFHYFDSPSTTRSRSPVEDMMRSITPVARSMTGFEFGASDISSHLHRVEQTSSQPPSPAKPPVPPKPEMISHSSWASIPGFFNSSVTPHQSMEHSYPSGSVNMFADPPPFASVPPWFPHVNIPVPVLPSVEAMPVPPVFHSRADLDASQESTHNVKELPSVPDHTPNPWPTTNTTEKQELLQLIYDFAGPSLSASSIISSSAQKVVESQTQSEPIRCFGLPGPAEPAKPTGASPPASPKQPLASSTTSSPTTYEKAGTVVEDAQAGWTSISSEMNRLLQAIEQDITRVQDFMAPNSVSVAHDSSSITDSPLSGEALLHRPSAPSSRLSSPTPPRRSLAELISELPSLIPVRVPATLVKASESRVITLSAAFVEDVTVPDGQVFPPGAEFVKCWRLLNDSSLDWPENTQVVFVAGESLSTEKPASTSVEVGKVSAGAEVDIWTGELKAPDAPGRYVGYWRLRADGELFGNSLWIEINVVESDSHHSSDESMAASSIIMPTASSAPQSEHIASTTVQSVSAPSTMATDDNLSDAGSDNSSISLISMPSSPSDDEDEALWHDSRSQTTAERAAAAAASAAGTPASAMDFVMLYDDNSSSEE